MSVFDEGGLVGPTDEQRAVLSAYADALGADVVLDREITDERLESSPYAAIVSDAVVGPVATCPTCWRSHGCGLPAGHPGDDYSHVCDPCPDGCSEPDLEDWPDGWSASVGRCSLHCGDHPISGDKLFDVTREGFTNERVLL